MKRAWYLAAVVALALVVPATAQIRGTPASVTSFGPRRGATPGPPASVTSLGPRGFSNGPVHHKFFNGCSGVGPLIPSALGCTPTQFTTGYFFPDARDRGPVNLRDRRHLFNSGAYYPVYVPYAYPVAVEPEPEEVEEPDPRAPTIFEHRATSTRVPSTTSDSRYGTNYLDRREQPANVVQEPSPAEARQQIPIVLVYKDGHQQEVSNYAIFGQTLYDLGTFVAHKIPLADLNLKATVKANDERGVEFALPTSVKLD